jgi:molecular chaperone HtpG
MERIMKAQALNENSMMAYMSGKRIMEINPYNQIVKSLAEMSTLKDKEHTFKNMVRLMYETALLSSGYTIEKPTDFAKKIFRLMQNGLSPENDDVSCENDVESNENQVETESSKIMEEVD